MMLVSHDPGEGVAYIYLTEVGDKVHRTVTFESKRGIVNLDLDRDGDVVGVEVLG